MSNIAIALGANIGERNQAFAQSILACHSWLRSIRTSSWIETDPVGYLDQPPFLNGMIIGECFLDPEEVLEKLQKIEQRLGRVPSIRNGPRCIDLDFIFCEQMIVNNPKLVLPHPRMHERQFVLEPLCQLEPLWRHPIFNKTAQELLSLIKPLSPVLVDDKKQKK